MFEGEFLHAGDSLQAPPISISRRLVPEFYIDTATGIIHGVDVDPSVVGGIASTSPGTTYRSIDIGILREGLDLERDIQMGVTRAQDVFEILIDYKPSANSRIRSRGEVEAITEVPYIVAARGGDIIADAERGYARVGLNIARELFEESAESTSHWLAGASRGVRRAVLGALARLGVVLTVWFGMESVAEAQASAGSDPESQRRATTIAVGRELFSFAAGEAGAGIGAITCIEAGPLSVVCGVIGGVIGGFAGEEAGEAIAEELSSAISTAIGAVSDAINHLIYPGYSSVLTPLMSRF